MSDDFFALPISTQRKIDKAFDYALRSINQNTKLIAENPSYGSNSPGENIKMPYSVVHLALKFLNLPQDDEDILMVLRKAAQGWHEGPSAEGNVSQATVADGFISRKDWRAVCAVLFDAPLEHETSSPYGDAEERHHPEYEGENQDNADIEDLQGGYVVQHTHQESSIGSDIYRGDQLAGSTDSYVSQDSDDTYDAGDGDANSDTPSDFARRYGSRSSSTKEKQVEGLKLHQKHAALEAFALFFPSYTSEAAIIAKRLTVEDLDRAAKSLRENSQLEEVLNI